MREETRLMIAYLIGVFGPVVGIYVIGRII
jgi:hypothetical protein